MSPLACGLAAAQLGLLVFNVFLAKLTSFCFQPNLRVILPGLGESRCHWWGLVAVIDMLETAAVCTVCAGRCPSMALMP